MQISIELQDQIRTMVENGADYVYSPHGTESDHMVVNYFDEGVWLIEQTYMPDEVVKIERLA